MDMDGFRRFSGQVRRGPGGRRRREDTVNNHWRKQRCSPVEWCGAAGGLVADRCACPPGIGKNQSLKPKPQGMSHLRLSLQRERTEVPLHALRCPVCTKTGSKIDPPLVVIYLELTHGAPRTESGSICRTQSREKWAVMSWNHSRTTRQRGAATREGSTHGSPGVNRFMTLLLLSVLGLVRFDPQTDLRSGAIS